MFPARVSRLFVYYCNIISVMYTRQTRGEKWIRIQIITNHQLNDNT